MPATKERDFGKICMFLSRSCGAFSSVVLLLCGFVTLIPLPSQLAGSYGRCMAVGLIMIVSAVVMFFLELSVLGYCVERLSFLLVLNRYFKDWMRALLYISLAFVPLLLWCISASTLISLFTLFTLGAINFVLAVGTKGDHTESYSSVRMSVMESRLVDDEDEEASEDDFEKQPMRESDV